MTGFKTDAWSSLFSDHAVAARQKRHRRAKRLVLCVDDCVAQRDLYELMLADDFEIASANRGRDALAIAAERQPDVIVLDMQMPEMNGIEVCRRLKGRADTADIPVVMLTGVPHDITAEALAAGAAAVLTKPCPIDTLVENMLGAIVLAEAGMVTPPHRP
jgi:CheY-like chemotaxis protein